METSYPTTRNQQLFADAMNGCVRYRGGGLGIKEYLYREKTIGSVVRRRLWLPGDKDNRAIFKAELP